MDPADRPHRPPLSERAVSAITVGAAGFLSRCFLYLPNRTETSGLNRFLCLLDARYTERERQRGLITVSNHVSVLDDPLIWGVLPFWYHWHPENMRWSLGSYDICFQNGQSGVLSKFFTYGHTLPTQRIAHSDFGGLFQPTITQTIRLLSDPYGVRPIPSPKDRLQVPVPDPFSSSELTYSTNGTDCFSAPAAYPSRRFSWVHIFPEGRIHQHPGHLMRYFKWGIARLILEAEPCPDVVPMWIEGPELIMSEDRRWPRFVPRTGKDVHVTFGEPIDRDVVLEPLRTRWRELKRKAGATLTHSQSTSKESDSLGELTDPFLRSSPEAEELRIDVTLAVRNEVLRLRRERGWPDEDPKNGVASTYQHEGPRRDYGQNLGWQPSARRLDRAR